MGNFFIKIRLLVELKVMVAIGLCGLTMAWSGKLPKTFWEKQHSHHNIFERLLRSIVHIKLSAQSAVSLIWEIDASVKDNFENGKLTYQGKVFILSRC
jgi:hypothetical protein